MASEYYNNRPYYYSMDNSNSSSSYYDYSQPDSPLSIHLCFFLSILFLFLGFSWYLSYESAFESLLDKVKMLLMLLPVAFLLVIHCLSSVDRSWVSFLMPLPERDSFDSSSGSPWGVALVLLLLIFMVSYKSSLQEKWFPLISR